MTILLHHLLISFLLLLLALSANCLPSSPASKSENSTPKKQRPLSPAPEDTSLYSKHGEEWRKKAIAALWRERKQMAYTPLVVFDKIPGALILFKNESASATESLKHRYSWALVMWALLQGFIHPNSTVYEASSGNTARSEAYMCSLIGAKFVTVLPETTEAIKVANIEREGGRVQKIPFGNTLGRAQQMADEDVGGFFINQFGNSEQALEFHESGNHSLGSVNLFHEILSQMAERNIAGTPTHFIHSAATGGTISSIGRYIKKYGLETEIVLADTQFSAYYDLLVSDRFVNGSEDPQPLWVPPGMAGTGFGWAGPIIRGQTSSLVPEVIDRALKIPDLASVAGMHILRDQFDIDGGPSTGVNFAAALQLIGSVRRRNGKPSNGRAHPVLATLIADNGVNYRSTYYNQSWIDRSFGPHGGLTGLRCWRKVFDQFLNDLRASENLNGTAAALTESIRDPIQFGAAKCAPPIQSAQ